MRTSGNPTMWAIFVALVVVMLAFDLGIFARAKHAVTVKEALVRSAFWVALAAAFNGGVYALVGEQQGLEFTAGYLLEEALSVDNLFVFVVIFTAFRVSPLHQVRVLFWGIVGAVLLRGLFIGVGTVLVQRFSWVMILFGLLLLYTAFKLFKGDDDEGADPEKNIAYRLFRKYVPSTPDVRGPHFFVKENGKWLATPLLAVLVLVETSDVLFALDSIPAVFGVTKDPFIVYTSNIFAILGLRSMYFLLAAIVQKFVYLKTGLAIILAFIGGKMVAQQWVHISTGISLGIIAGVLAATIGASLLWPPRPKETAEHPP
jgi:tellurite resistance protein TerC